MYSNQTRLPYREIEITEFTTSHFSDARGHSFEVTYDALTGNVVELSCIDPSGHVLTQVRKQDDSCGCSWRASKVELLEHVDNSDNDSIPGITKFLADARFDCSTGELTLASQRLNKRWTFRTNGSIEFFNPLGHKRIPHS
ncbi:MAG: hypothetical protein K2X93_19960 [Candidatus Obscuribacterales bacterium]|nr:hypothetical protein [Candidatus Obscuribacterales bacterium]